MFTFKGESSNDHGIIVEEVIRPLLPPVNNTLAEISRRPGALLQRSRIGVKEVSIRIRVLEDSYTDYTEKLKELASWLYSDNVETLILPGAENYFYKAKLDGSTDLERITHTKGKTTLKFIMPDPFAYGLIDYTRLVPAGTGTTSFNVDGTYKTFPIIRATFKRAAPFFMYATERDGEQVVYGEPATDTKPEQALPLHEVRLSENFSDISDWQAGTVVEDGQVLGTMEASSSGTGSVTYGTFGTTPDASRKWYGPAIKRSLPEALEDWKVEFIFSFQNNDAAKMGRIEIYLMDQNGSIIGRLSAYDRKTSVSDTEMKISIGPANTREDIINTNGGKVGTYNKFYGMLSLRKNGTNYEAYVGIYSTATKTYHTQITRRFYDVDNKFSSARLAQVELHIGAFGAAEILPKTNINADNLIVYRRNNPIEEAEVAKIVDKGDVLEFNHNTKQITLNGVPYKRHLNPISNMFGLQPGANTIGFQPADLADIEIIYKSRWL